MEKKNNVLTFKADEHFQAHLKKKADEKDLRLGTYIKAVLKKYTQYKEKELV